MKRSMLFSAVATALYSVGVAQAADLGGQEVGKLTAPNVTTEQIQQFQKQLVNNPASMMQNDGLNVQVNLQGTKFVEEELITGEQVYFVRLHANAVSAQAKDSNSSLHSALAANGTKKLYQQGKASVQAVADYENQLLAYQQQVLSSIESVAGKVDVRQQFTKAMNGFSVTMTPMQARRIANLSNVASVMRSKNYDLLSDTGPEHIGSAEVWDGTAPLDSMSYKGEGQVVAIIDTGINSDHPSFADIGDDGYDHTNPWGEGVYVGNCADPEVSELVNCNDKLIGMRSYSAITDNFEAMRPGWPAIAEDYQGHGSHVAATAAGNVLYDVDMLLPEAGENADGIVLKEDLFPVVSGVAPHANIIAYQVCNPTNDQGYRGCPGEALVAGIEDAIADGVDVINFSIGGADSNVWADPVQLAFLSAREAGISVAAAAGNSGQACGAECFGVLDNSSPWLAQVAATTHGREIAVDTAIDYAGFIDESLGSELPSWSETGLVGGAINDTELTGVVVWAKDYADINGTKDYNGYCVDEYPVGTFENFKDGTAIPGAADGTTNVIVVCQRHDPADPNANARTAKVANVQAGGADGFIMFNRNQSQGTVPTKYDLPSVHFTYEQWNGKYYSYNNPENTDGLEDWIDSYSEKGHMITIKETVIERRVDPANADFLATFSSRGPSFQNIETLAPTMSAPGVNIMAAYSDEQPFTATPFGQDFAAISGTSMASPHVAGAMALLRQAQPEWSATEIQSALSMTADDVVQYHRLNNPADQVGHAQIYRAGAGRINVAKAVKAGLVMDESAENFMAANPFNGGTPHKLNMPNLVDFSCAPECQWIRTVKATRDGSWTVSNSDVLNWNFDMKNQSAQNGVNIDVTPREFSLKAGETQTIVVKASIMDTQDWFSNSEVELHSNLIFTADDVDIPNSQWPVVFKYDRGDLPSRLVATAHRDNSNYQVNNVMLPYSETPYSRVYQPVKAEQQTIVLPKDNDGFFPWSSDADMSIDMAERLDEATYTTYIDVPENAKRLIVESLGVVDSPAMGTFDKGNVLVYVGKDYNGNGQADPFEELLCVSNHILYDNFCNINNPESGQYWAIFYNSKESGPFDEAEETFTVSTAVVTGDIADNMSMETPASDGEQAVNLTVSWDMPMEEGDIYYTSLDIGTSEINAGNLGNIPFKLIRGKNDVTLDVPQDKALAGQTLPYTFAVLANNSGADRAFSISAKIPEGLRLNVEDVLASNDSVSDITIDGEMLTISGVQIDTSAMTPGYAMTTNLTDAMCRTPNFGNSTPGGYVDLSEFGIGPLFGGFDERNQPDYRSGTILPTELMFNGATDTYHLFNNTDNLNVDNKVMGIRSNGFVDLWGHPNFWADFRPFPYNAFPYEGIGVLWRGWGPDSSGAWNNDFFATELSANSGISIASTGTWSIIEWDNAADYTDPVYDRFTRSYSWTKLDNSFDFEMIINKDTRFGAGQYEMYMAYDNIDFGTADDRGSIGLQGFKGPVYIRGPLSAYLGAEYTFGNLKDKVSNDLVVCYDYVGPESSQFEVTAWFDIAHSAAGAVLVFDAVSSIEGMQDIEMTHTVDVASNLSIGAFNDMETDRKVSISFPVYYADEQNSVNEISAYGEGIDYSVESHESGSIITITPQAQLLGETEVTVMVSDVENPSDAASASFMLTVNGKNTAPKAEVVSAIEDNSVVVLDASSSTDDDGDNLTYLWEGPGEINNPEWVVTEVTGLSAGTYTFTLTISDGIETTVLEVEVEIEAEQNTIAEKSDDDDSSGGALYFLLLLLPLAMRRKA
ncbi:S8 family serine peptidase [Thalassotalea sp. HSM 43]|uniref:S8 family serine peptidase n=1 Tax=Thalassotalea sp. HSM 43 TaxID=2552945 RepID=UPI00167733CC|nr:S8 family serine peptidase [Thalassotalea sp. HSM 43]